MPRQILPRTDHGVDAGAVAAGGVGPVGRVDDGDVGTFF
jgi:hypothetical protein